MSRLIWVLFLTLIACQSRHVAPVVDLSPAASRHARVQDTQGRYVVQPGDTLYSIALSFDKDYRVLCKINKLPKSCGIYPKMVLQLDEAHQEVSSSPMPVLRKTHRALVLGTAVKKPTVAKKPLETGVQSWIWPVQGHVIAGFSTQALGNKGIDILGKRGESVHAVASGRVVYCGSGLVGYGLLVIIQHAGPYLSVYAHNDRILVHEGERVHQGDVVARLGSSGADRVGLHFEIRQAGLPIDPLSLLPKQ